MTHDEQVAALRARLATLDAEIAGLQAALAASTNPDERSALSAQIAEKQQEREAVRQMLNNLGAPA